MYVCGGGLLVVLLVVVHFTGKSSAERCSFDSECEWNQVCYQGTCRCQMGFKGIPNGFGLECYEKFCSNRNDECTRTFGNSGCVFDDGIPRCVCDEGFVWNPNSENCESHKVTPETCASNAKCGFRSHCIQGQCRCELGYEWRMLSTYDGSLFKQICVRKMCKYNEDCSELFPNSRCASGLKKCVCKDKFQLDKNNQSCVAKKKIAQKS